MPFDWRIAVLSHAQDACGKALFLRSCLQSVTLLTLDDSVPEHRIFALADGLCAIGGVLSDLHQLSVGIGAAVDQPMCLTLLRLVSRDPRRSWRIDRAKARRGRNPMIARRAMAWPRARGPAKEFTSALSQSRIHFSA
jgi:hypothetical protein